LRATHGLVIVAEVGMDLFSPTWGTSTQGIVAMLTVKTGPCTGSYTGLFASNPRGRHLVDCINGDKSAH